MLLVEIAGTWRHLEPAEVAEAILSGRLHRETRARDFARGAEPERIESALGPEHCHALSAKLIAIVRSILSAEKLNIDEHSSFGLGSFKDRVVELSHWELFGPEGRRTRLRLTWLSAWLAELLGRNVEAVEQYTTFLRLRPMKEEQGLHLLARNNRAVLLLQQGRLRAVRNLARVAFTSRLPGACLSLLNVINVARGNGTLAAIDPVITGALNRLPVAERLYWTGPDDDQAESPEPATRREAAQRAPAKATGRTLCSDPALVSHLIVALVRHAIQIRPAPAPGFRSDRPAAKPSDGLELWSQPPELLVAPLHGAGAGRGDGRGEGRDERRVEGRGEPRGGPDRPREAVEPRREPPRPNQPPDAARGRAEPGRDRPRESAEPRRGPEGERPREGGEPPRRRESDRPEEGAGLNAESFQFFVGLFR